MRVLMIVLALAMLVPAAGSAQSVDGCESELAASCSLRISICPNGDFEKIADGCGGSDDYIEVVIRDFAGQPIAGIPDTDFWMNSCDLEQSLCVCAQHFVADSLTGANGRTTFSGRISAGGCITEGGIYISCQGRTIMQSPSCIEPVCLDAVIVSPDINADCAINLTDLSYLGMSYNMQEGDASYSTCCDFNDDGECNLVDFAHFGQHYGQTCF